MCIRDRNNAGAVYVFDLTTGQQVTKLFAKDADPNNGFGASIAISGTRAVIGAPFDGDNGTGSGSVYVFDLVKGQQTAKLLASDGQEVDNFGESVAVFGDRAVIGARNDDDNGFDAGAAYVFDISTGQELFKLLASDGESDDEFGCSVAICDVQVLVGARREDEKGTSSGAAYVFDVATGQQVAKLCASDGTEGGYFGWSAAFTGDRALVGAMGDKTQGDFTGALYLLDPSTGQQLSKLVASDAQAGDQYGYSLAASGDLAVVGAVGQADGVAYVIEPLTGQELFKLSASDGVAGNYFARTVATSGDTVLVSAYRDSDQGQFAGAVYVYRLGVDCGTTYCGPDQNPNNSSGIAIDTCESAATSIQVSLYNGPPNQFIYLLVGDGNGTASQPPGAKGDLCVIGGSCLGRYDKDVGQINFAGQFSTDVRNAVSNPCQGAVNLSPGSTWNFQYWHRQPMGQPATFSGAISVTFQ